MPHQLPFFGATLGTLAAVFLLWSVCPYILTVCQSRLVRWSRARRYQENRAIVTHTARKLDLSPALVLAVAQAESGFDDRVVSSSGAVGLMQVMPATGKEVAESLKLREWSLENPRDNTLIGATYLKKMLRRFRGDRHLALAAYHAGPNQVDAWIKEGQGLPGPEVIEQFAFDVTRTYVFDVLNRATQTSAKLQNVSLKNQTSTRGRQTQQAVPLTPETPNTARYACTVQNGDTLSAIAVRHGVSIEQIAQLNALGDNHVLASARTLLLRPLPGMDPISFPLNPDDVEVRVYKIPRRVQLMYRGHTIRTYACGLGWDPRADKEKEGDGRTPLGAFYVCQRLAKGRYGASLGISYPNIEDARRGLESHLISAGEFLKIRTRITRRQKPPWTTQLGGAICLHGKGAGRDWTAGCMALNDADINELFALTPMGTRVIILATRDKTTADGHESRVGSPRDSRMARIERY